MKTFDVITTLRTMFVGLSEEQASKCAAALQPIQAVRVDDLKEACERMSTVLPLFVVVSTRFDDAQIAEVRDVAETCTAEVLLLDEPLPADYVDQLHQTLRRADRRRSATARNER